MPGWHGRTRDLVGAGKLQVLGLIQEQHPDRCRLFMQWKGMDWPILVDSLNLLGVSRVPLTYLIDEHGIIRAAQAKPDDLDAFLSTSTPPPKNPGPPPAPPDLDAQIRTFDAQEKRSLAGWLLQGDRLFLRGMGDDLSRSVEHYRRVIEFGGPPEAHFRLGVALRRRWESDQRRPGDFQACIDAWRAALQRNPNQYIWRRRIQQYGPRLDKPYPFYGWVHEAREEIAARGEEPVALRVEPSGAEFADPEGDEEPAPREKSNPDPEGRIDRDKAPLILLEIAVAPGTGEGQKAARVHLSLRPNEAKKGHWNNEAEDTLVWLDPPEGVQLHRRWFTLTRAKTETSSETRSVEFEVRHETAPPPGKPLTIPGYVLTYACEDVDGACLYLRKDFRIQVPHP